MEAAQEKINSSDRATILEGIEEFLNFIQNYDYNQREVYYNIALGYAKVGDENNFIKTMPYLTGDIRVFDLRELSIQNRDMNESNSSSILARIFTGISIISLFGFILKNSN